MTEMETITETVVALYYRMPYEEERDLVCICESEQIAKDLIKRLREDWPDLYKSQRDLKLI